jgi:hypothetical protein
MPKRGPFEQQVSGSGCFEDGRVGKIGRPASIEWGVLLEHRV